eukprot:GEZU01002951.1.p2 GENE.GEZU01002951.1~~GEZU01002951.1.p2  ORF type:complete len:262 (+),score=72.01 GEZU01002951.1:23-787(+)
MSSLFQLAFDALFVFGPVVGYVTQYQEIQRKRSSDGFSPLVSFILITSNCLRLFYWYGARFDTVLLVQSIVLIAAQFIMIQICTRYPSPSAIGQSLFEMRSIKNFWNWDNMQSYVMFVLSFNTVVLVISAMFMQFETYVELLGFCSTMIEAALGIPQLVKNHQKRSTDGLSFTLIMTWFVGDLFKTVFFIAKGMPFQFILCGAIQLTVDILILTQMRMYASPTKVKLPSGTSPKGASIGAGVVGRRSPATVLYN